MKTSLLFGTAFVALGVAVAPMFAQTQTTTSTSSTGYIQTSKLIGTKVKASQGEEIGVIKDVVLDRNTGCMAYTVLSAGGTGTRATGQAKIVAVPWTVYSPSSDPSILMVRVDRDRIYNAPVFDYARIDEYGTTGYQRNGEPNGKRLAKRNHVSGENCFAGRNCYTEINVQCVSSTDKR